MLLNLFECIQPSGVFKKVAVTRTVAAISVFG